jgi:hypothetical protein
MIFKRKPAKLEEYLFKFVQIQLASSTSGRQSKSRVGLHATQGERPPSTFLMTLILVGKNKSFHIYWSCFAGVQPSFTSETVNKTFLSNSRCSESGNWVVTAGCCSWQSGRRTGQPHSPTTGTHDCLISRPHLRAAWASFTKARKLRQVVLAPADSTTPISITGLHQGLNILVIQLM